MAFKDWAGITNITKQKWRSLRINFDRHDKDVFPVFLYSTYKEDGSVDDHDHIELDKPARKALLEWLLEFDKLTQNELVTRTEEPHPNSK